MSAVRYSSLSNEQLDAIIKYYRRHTAAATCKQFNLGRSGFNTFIEKHGLTVHSSSKAETLKHLKQDNYDLFSTEDEQNIINKAIELNSVAAAAKFFNVKEYYVNFLLAENNITNVASGKQISAIAMFETQLSSVDHSAVIDYYLTPHTLADTRHYFNISTNVIKKILQIANVPLHSTEVNNELGAVKRDATILERYGCNNVFQNEKIKAKSADTKLKKYGDANYTNRAKASQTCLERYGSDTFLGSDEGQSAIKKYNQERYGCDYAFQSDEWQHNPEILATRIESMSNNKYSEAYYSDLYLQVCRDKDSFSKFIENKTVNQLITELNVNRDHIYYLLCKYNLQDSYKKDFSGTSLAEQELVDFIGADLCECSNRTILDGKEIDIYVPTKKLGIEFNGTHWHSTEINADKNYHFNKSKLAAEKGIRLIHIYEYEWNDKVQQEKIKMLLDIALGRVKTRIFAKNCTIKQISNAEAKKLNDKVHLQGHRNAQVTYGLYYNNELVQLMSFSRTKYNRNLADDNSWEIIRGCPGSNNIVVGGVSKLLKHFIADYKPSKVFSYCDFNKFDGKSYEACGMKFIGYTGPDMKWVMPDYSVVNRQPSKHAELKERAIAQIFGAGSKKYQLDLDSKKDYSV